MTDAAPQIAAGRHDARVPDPDLGGDFATLTRTLNALAERLAAVETTRRRMLADLAHEMRTLLATIDVHLEAVEDGVRNLDQDTVAVLRDSTQRLRRLAEDIEPSLTLKKAASTSTRVPWTRPSSPPPPTRPTTGTPPRPSACRHNATALETSAPDRHRRDGQVRHPHQGRTRGHRGRRRGHRPDRLLALAAAVERESEHPLAQAVATYADDHGAPVLRATGFRNVAGHGALADVDGHRVAIGSRRLMETEDLTLGSLADRRNELAAGGRTAVLVAVDGQAVGVLGIADAVRGTSAAAVTALHDAGVAVVMLTGDNQATAQRIANELGIDTVIAEALPEDKSSQVTELQKAGRRVAMVGDGVNDAPALVAADIGIAIGTGTDVAIETADVVLMRSDPLDVPTALTIGRGTLRKMRQNLGWAIGYNTVALPIAAGVFEARLRPRATSRDRGAVHVRVELPGRGQRPAPQAPAPARTTRPARTHPCPGTTTRRMTRPVLRSRRTTLGKDR